MQSSRCKEKKTMKDVHFFNIYNCELPHICIRYVTTCSQKKSRKSMNMHQTITIFAHEDLIKIYWSFLYGKVCKPTAQFCLQTLEAFVMQRRKNHTALHEIFSCYFKYNFIAPWYTWVSFRCYYEAVGGSDFIRSSTASWPLRTTVGCSY